MRNIIILILACLLTTTAYASENDSLKLEGVQAISDGQTTILAASIKNTTGSAIKAFRATLIKVNDFDEGKPLCKIEFSSESEYRDSSSRPTSHHIIKAGETIFYTITVEPNGRGAIRFLSGSPGMPAAQGKYRLGDIQVVADK